MKRRELLKGAAFGAIALSVSSRSLAMQARGAIARLAALEHQRGGRLGVAVLDTGFDLKHPDFPSRSVTAVSFVPGAKPQDGHGHGTHCIGTACGPKEPYHPPRYGVAWGASLSCSGVLPNDPYPLFSPTSTRCSFPIRPLRTNSHAMRK